MVDFGGTKMDINSRLLKDRLQIVKTIPQSRITYLMLYKPFPFRRIIMIGKAVDDNMANAVVAQLLYLANEDPNADITMYINSPGDIQILPY